MEAIWRSFLPVVYSIDLGAYAVNFPIAQLFASITASGNQFPKHIYADMAMLLGGTQRGSYRHPAVARAIESVLDRLGVHHHDAEELATVPEESR